ncbi:arabinose efflux permease family protein [Serratia sp. FGI94]|uniref:MFS transporter n=1 Tax=Serratia sp. FGI94 TaxID=671990 RepID=UPI0002A6FD8F|nr:MFS transporter [Serratia sp. FGI94]AGB84060.1 arabinose efflux permease family protein [Serratia sp. FGI94]
MPSRLKISTRLFLLIVLTGAFLGQFDLFVVNVAAPSVQRSLALSDGGLELVVAGYAFMFAALLITGGRLGDLYGYQRVYVFGMLGFSLTTLLCALSPNGVTLIIARLLQGGAAGLMIPQVLALLTTVLPAEERTPAMGWYGAATGLGSVLGQFAGGALVSWDFVALGWRWIFLVTVPLGMVMAGIAWRYLPPCVGSRRRKFDVPGTLGLASAFGLMIGAFLFYGHTRALMAAALLLCAGMLILVVTLCHEQRLIRQGGDPVVDLRLCRVASLWRGLLAVCLFMLYFSSFIFLLTNVLQRGLMLSPLLAGLVFVPSGLTFISSSLFFRRWAAAHQRLAILTGCGVSAVGLLLAAWGTLFVAAPVWFLLAAVVITGCGNGLILPVLIGFALRQVPSEQAGMGSALLSSAQQFASALGISAFGTLFYLLSASQGLVHAMGWCVLIQLACMALVALITGSGRAAAHHQAA